MVVLNCFYNKTGLLAFRPIKAHFLSLFGQIRYLCNHIFCFFHHIFRQFRPHKYDIFWWKDHIKLLSLVIYADTFWGILEKIWNFAEKCLLDQCELVKTTRWKRWHVIDKRSKNFGSTKPVTFEQLDTKLGSFKLNRWYSNTNCSTWAVSWDRLNIIVICKTTKQSSPKIHREMWM